MASAFQQLLSADFLAQTLSEAQVESNNGVYSPLVVLWLLVAQRLQGGTSMQSAVIELLRGLPASFWPRPCKRVRDWRERGKAPSSHTGGYNQARQALPLSVVQKSSDHIFQQLLAQVAQPQAAAAAAFILDGSTLRAPHTPDLCRAYPPSSNQYGDAHWPLLRVLVAHDLHTGLAMRPEWGPVNGKQAVSEQTLLERAIDRLPPRAIVVGDANFGVFSVAHAATQRQHPVVLRLTVQRARSMAGEALRDGIDRALEWKPTAADRKRHPELPADISVTGRLQVRKVQPTDNSAPFLLALFTTTPSTADDAFQTYGKRWSIETDLRTLKSTLRLDQLVCATPDMVAKEIDLGYVAYNLVRAFIGFASKRSGIPPRGYSFTKVRLILAAFGPLLANAPDPGSRQRIMSQVMTFIQQSKLPRRKRKRPSTPRAVWSKGSRYPSRKK